MKRDFFASAKAFQAEAKQLMLRVDFSLNGGLSFGIFLSQERMKSTRMLLHRAYRLN